MSSETIALLIKFFPTLLAGLIVILCVLRGFFRGFRKSNILLIHYLLAFAIGAVLYFTISKKIFEMDLNAIFSVLGSEFSQAHTIHDFIGVILKTNIPQLASLASNYYFQGIVEALGGLAINFVLAILCFFVIPIVLRLIFYLFYLLLYSERKHKKHKKAQGEKYRRHRLLGMVSGLVRGLVCATLTVSFINSFYFITVGGHFNEKGEETTNIQLLEALGKDYDLDINLLYDALKDSRSTGVGMIFDKIKIQGKPLDYFYADLYSSSNFKTFKKQENDEVAALSTILNSTVEGQEAMATLCIREELSLLIGLLEGVLETNAIKINGDKVQIDSELLLNEVSKIVDDTVCQSVFLSDVLPLALIAYVDEVQKGNISIQEDIDAYFTPQMVEDVKQIDIPGAISNIVKASIKLIQLLKVNPQTNQIDLKASISLDALLNYDPEVICEVFDDLSEIDLMTKVIFPIGTGIVFSSFESQLTDMGIATDDINLTSIDWKFEVSNIGNIYKNLVAMRLDVSKLTNTQIDPETGKTVQMDYISNYIKNDESKELLLDFVDSIMDSSVTSQLTLVMLKNAISKINVVNADGSASSTDASLQKIKDNLNARDGNGKLLYTTKHLKDDLRTFIKSSLHIFDLVGVFFGNNSDPMSSFKSMDTSSLRKALIGEDYVVGGPATGGIYKIKFLNGDLNDDGIVEEGMFAATDEMIAVLLKAYATSVFSAEDIESVEDWPREIDALINCINVFNEEDSLSEIDFSQNLLTSFPQMSDESIDRISLACSQSALMGGLIENEVVKSFKDEDSVTVEGEYEWLDKLNDDGTVAEYGELNRVMKVLVVVNKPENKIDFSSSTSIMNGLSNLESKEIDTITNSKIMKNSLSDMMADVLYPNDPNATISDEVEWSNQYDEEGNLVKKGELQLLSDSLKIDVLKDENGDVKISKLEDVDTIAQLIKTKENGYPDYQDVVTLSSSEIIMTVMSDKVSNLSKDGEDVAIVVPEKLVHNNDTNKDAWKLWAYDSEFNREKGEFAKLVFALYSTRNYVLTLENSNYEKLTNDNLLEGVIGLSDHSVIADSLVLYATISNKLIDLSNDDKPAISIRDEAKISDETLLVENDGIVIIKNEVILVLDGARELGLANFNDVNTSLVIEKIRESEAAREKLCVSNILNKTVVDKLINNSKDALKFPQEYNSSEKDGWYPKFETEFDWEECELNKVLKSVAELSDGDNAGIIIEGDTITTNTNRLFKDLNTKVKGTEDTKLNVVYRSEVMSYNITDKIKEQETNGVISIRLNAYVDKNALNNILESEVEMLVSFLNDNGFKIDNSDKDEPGLEVNAENLLPLVGDIDNRSIMCFSNILNISIVQKITTSESVKIPSELKDSNGSVDLNAIDWYPNENLNITSQYNLWSECETNKLLLAVDELQTKVNEDDEAVIVAEGDVVTVNTEESIYILNEPAVNGDGSKIEVIYQSLVMQQTISDYIINDTELDIPATYIVKAGEEAYEVVVNTRIIKDEIICLVDAINILNITLDENNSDEEKVKIADLQPSCIMDQSDDDIKRIFNSAIISLKTSEILEEKPKVEIPTNKEFKVGLVEKINEEVVLLEEKAEIETVYSEEIALLLLALKDMEFNVDENNNEPFDISTMDIEKLKNNLSSSYIFHATMSVQITDNTENIPTKYVDGVTDTKDELEYLISDEIVALVTVFKDMDLEFTDIDSGTLSNMNVSTVISNIDNMLKSAIIHSLLSENLAEQTQTFNAGTTDEKTLGIVTYTYVDSGTEQYNVTLNVLETKYVVKDEIKKLLNGLQILGIDNMSQASTITLDSLAAIASSVDKRQSVYDSTILSTIISNILVNQTNRTDLLTKHNVTQVMNDESVLVLSKTDINTILENY